MFNNFYKKVLTFYSCVNFNFGDTTKKTLNISQFAPVNLKEDIPVKTPVKETKKTKIKKTTSIPIKTIKKVNNSNINSDFNKVILLFEQSKLKKKREINENNKIIDMLGMLYGTLLTAFGGYLLSNSENFAQAAKNNNFSINFNYYGCYWCFMGLLNFFVYSTPYKKYMIIYNILGILAAFIALRFAAPDINIFVYTVASVIHYLATTVNLPIFRDISYRENQKKIGQKLNEIADTRRAIKKLEDMVSNFSSQLIL